MSTPDTPFVEQWPGGLRYQWGMPTPAKMRTMLLSRAKHQMQERDPIVGDLRPGNAWHMRAAADVIDKLQQEIIRLGGT